jgi:hypothetical protein
MKIIGDITEEEEERLPLPDNWIRHFSPTVGYIIYKNVINGMESEEHPFVLQSMKVARKQPLDIEWIVKETKLSDGKIIYLSIYIYISYLQLLYIIALGTVDYFYLNNNDNQSMWDPPSLRQCLSNCLKIHDHHAAANWILTNDDNVHIDKNINKSLSQSINKISNNNNNNNNNKVVDAYEIFQKQNNNNIKMEVNDLYDDIDEDGNFRPGRHTNIINHNNHNNNNNNNMNNKKNYTDTNNNTIMNDYNNEVENNEFNDYSDENNDEDITDEDVNNNNIQSTINSPENILLEKWGRFRHQLTEVESELISLTYRLDKTKPPKTIAGLTILSSDVNDANMRVHELLVKLRVLLCTKDGVDCTLLNSSIITNINNTKNEFVQNFENKSNNVAINDIVSLASEIINLLHNKFELLISAMIHSKIEEDGSSNMVQLGYIIIHRLFHPFSTDNEGIASLLLAGINQQVKEVALVEKLLPEIDREILVSRSLFIIDPSTVINWNPLAQPLPLVPNVQTETPIACLLKLFAIRRDITSFFRAIWKSVLPAAVAVVSTNDITGSSTFANLVSVAYRILECSLNETVTVKYPNSLKSVIRSLYDKGGYVTVHTYLLNLLLLPNVVKLFSDIDTESIDNERIYRGDDSNDFCDHYFDLNLWWPIDGFSSIPFNSFNTLIWLIWRLYTGATLINEATVAILKSKDFFSGGPNINIQGVPDQKLRSLLTRLRRKIECGYNSILSNISIDEIDNSENGHIETYIDENEFLCQIKPNELLKFTLFSRFEISCLFNCIMFGMESTNAVEGSLLYVALGEYLNIDDTLGENNSSEELILIPFQLPDSLHGVIEDDNATIDSLQKQQGTSVHDNTTITERYQYLCRGLQLANRYEDALLRILRGIHNSHQRSTKDLLEEDSVGDQKVEFDLDFKVTSNFEVKHTNVSAQKIKQTHFGLIKNPNSQPSNDVSSTAQHNQFFNSYRFGTTVSTPAGSSMGMSKVGALPASYSSAQKSNNVTSSINNFNNSKYTKIDVSSNSNFLAPTESLRNKSIQLPLTHVEKEKVFIKSLRTADIIPTDEFRQRRHKNRKIMNGLLKNSSQNSNSNNNNSESNSLIGSESIDKYSSAKPFPEFLRNRIRNKDQVNVYDRHNTYNNGDDFDDDDDDDDDNYYLNPENNDDYDNEDYDRNPEAVSELLRQYEDIFTPLTSKRNEKLKDNQYNQYHQNPNNHVGNHAAELIDNNIFDKNTLKYKLRSPLSPKSPGKPTIPEPAIPGTSFSVPTQSLLKKLSTEIDNDNPGAKFYRDISTGVTPFLRVSSDNINAVYDSSDGNRITRPAFRNTGQHIVPPTGARIPRNGTDRGSSKSPVSSKSSRRIQSNNNNLNSSNNVNNNINVKNIETDESNPIVDDIDYETNTSKFYKEPVVNEQPKAPSTSYSYIPPRGSIKTSNVKRNDDNENIMRYTLVASLSSKNIQFNDEDNNINKQENNGVELKKPLISKSKMNIFNRDSFVSQLMTGIEVKKHGRNGSSKTKLLTYNERNQEIKWSNFNNIDKKSFFSIKKSDQNSAIILSSITEIRRGIQTNVMMKAKHIDPSSSFSIITDDRTLDLTFTNSQQRDMIFKTFQTILKEYDYNKVRYL